MIVEYRSPFVKARICRESAFTASLIRFMLVAGTTKSLCVVRITAKINGRMVSPLKIFEKEIVPFGLE